MSHSHFCTQLGAVCAYTDRNSTVLYIYYKVLAKYTFIATIYITKIYPGKLEGQSWHNTALVQHKHDIWRFIRNYRVETRQLPTNQLEAPKINVLLFVSVVASNWCLKSNQQCFVTTVLYKLCSFFHYESGLVPNSVSCSLHFCLCIISWNTMNLGREKQEECSRLPLGSLLTVLVHLHCVVTGRLGLGSRGDTTSAADKLINHSWPAWKRKIQRRSEIGMWAMFSSNC